MRSWITEHFNENKNLLVFLILMMVFRSSLADWNVVPTGSMKPTIIEGDRILVNKMAYDIRVPFTHISIHKRGDPDRGDIIVFDSKMSGKRLVKRVIGMPGDVIEMRNNVLRINGQTLEYTVISDSAFSIDKIENLLGLEHQVRIKQRGSPLSDFAAVRIPADSYLALGDNRDNSVDSRVIGFIPRREIVGRTKKVVMSLNYENAYKPRRDRFLKAL